MIWASVPHYNVRVEGIEVNAKAIVQEVSKIIRMESCRTLEGKRVFWQSFGSGSGSALIWFDGSGSRRTKMTHKNIKERDG
jgi:hypothetical protein